MNHGSLFSGIGGFDLAAEWMGWDNKFHCEWNEFGQRVLNYYFPQAISYNDITKTDFTIWRGKIDILTGGFPCQPYSQAGKRLGKEDDRHLWPEMLRAIREIQPKWVVGENVFGLINWNGGLVFDEVQADLESEGYEVQAYVLPAVAVNAPHRRDRVWFIAKNTMCSRFIQRESIQERTEIRKQRNTCTGNSERIHREKGHNATNTNGIGQHEFRPHNSEQKSEWRKTTIGRTDREQVDNGQAYHRPNDFEQFPTQSPICGGDDGIPTELDGITFPKWRQESIKSYGNAIVPQVALQIFKAIQEYENTK